MPNPTAPTTNSGALPPVLRQIEGQQLQRSLAVDLKTAEGMAIGLKAGLDPAAMVDVLNVSSGRSSATEDKWPRSVLPRTFDFGFTAGLSLKDVRLCLAEARTLGVPLFQEQIMKIAITLAFVGTVLSETVAANRGIGNVMMIASGNAKEIVSQIKARVVFDEIKSSHRVGELKLERDWVSVAEIAGTVLARMAEGGAIAKIKVGADKHGAFKYSLK